MSKHRMFLRFALTLFGSVAMLVLGVGHAGAAPGDITTVAGNGTSGNSGDGGPATAAQIAGPTGLVLDGLGNLYISDNANEAIRKVDAAGIITTVPGLAVDEPNGLVVDGANNLYMAFLDVHQIHKLNALSGVSSVLVGIGTPGFSGDGGSAAAAQLNAPFDVAFDGAFNLYIADSANHRIRKMNAASGLISTVAGTGTPGYSGDGGAPIAAKLNTPVSIAFDGAGNLYIGDANGTIRKVDGVSGLISTVVGTGSPSFSGDGGPATAAQLGSQPTGIFFDALGDMYIADKTNFRVRKVEAATGIITTVAGDGTPFASGGDGGPATSAQICLPADVFVDGAGDLYIAGECGHRIRKVEGVPPSANVTVSVPAVTATYNQALVIPVSIDNATGIISGELTVEYDTDLLTFSSVSSTGTLTDGWSVESNTEAGSGPSLEKILIATAVGQSAAFGAQTLININFTVNDVRVPASSALALSDVVLNNGTPANVTIDGSVTLVGNDGTIDSSPQQVDPPNNITVTVVDLDADLDGSGLTDQVNVDVANGLQTETMTLNETTNPGEFTGIIATVFSLTSTEAVNSGDNIVQAKSGDAIVFSFTDQLDANGNGPIVRTDQTDVIGGTDGTVEITLATQPGDAVFVKVTDADLNLDPGAAETVQVVVTSTNGESETITLTEADVDDEVFFGSLNSTAGGSAGTNDDGTINAAKGDVLTATYNDQLTALGGLIVRTADDQVVDPFGDADGDGQVLAFDAAQVLLHVLGPILTGLELIQANVDLDPVGTGISPFDASLILQKRVHLINLFPVQTAASTNHPQNTPSSPKKAVERRGLVLAYGADYLSVQADERAGIVSGEVLLAGIDGQVQLAAELADFIVASRLTDEGLRILFAGPAPVEGPGELLRVYPEMSSDKAQLARAQFNDGAIVALVGAGASAAPLPIAFALHANWPNPFNPETTIAFDLPQAGGVALQIFDVLGQSVRTLVAESLPAGRHQLVWNGRDESGARVSSGVYVYRLQAAQQVHARRMLLLK